MEAHRLSRSKQPSNANGDRSCSPLSLKTLFLMCLGVCISLAVGLTIMFPDYIGSSYVTQSTRRGKKVNLVRTKQSTKGKVVNGTTGNVTSYDYGNMKVINAFTERLSYPWKRNITKLEHIRKEIQDFVKLKNNYILTKTNVHVGQKLPYSASPSRTFTLSKKVFNILGKVSPIGDKHYNTCTIVGNGGIILGSGCGHDIDSTEYVFRCNVSPLKAYSTDTGSKSNLVTVNKSLLSYRDQKTLKRDLADHDLAWLPVHSLPGLENIYIRIRNLLRNYHKPVVFMHPEHFAKTGKFWNSRGMEQRMTTGFYLTSLAIELCDQVLLYGFWPFTATADGKPVNYHYFDQMDLSTSTAHNFSTEFEVLLQLHEEGIIHLNIDKCD